MNSKEKCYWCGKPATSKEHVPPKCLFPEEKDSRPYYDNTFRKALITVPSCDAHNLAKSNDDEYLMVCLSGKIGNNGVAYIHTNTKVQRAIKRNPKLLKIEGERHLKVAGRKFPVLIVNIDSLRLVRSFEAIARAVFFHECKSSYNGKCWVISNIFISPDSKESTTFQVNAAQTLAKEQKSWNTEIKGDNPEIFTYQFSTLDTAWSFTLALTFYGNIKVYVVMNLWSSDENTFADIKGQVKPYSDEFLRKIGLK